MEGQGNQRLKGALFNFVVLQLICPFYFFIRFPESVRLAMSYARGYGFEGAARWIAAAAMLAYCIISTASAVMLLMRRVTFLRWFQIAGLIAMTANFISFILREIHLSIIEEGYYSYRGNDFWFCFVLALLWTVGWCIYFARSSRTYSYMGNNPEYIRRAFFTKNVPEPHPWTENELGNGGKDS